MAHIALTVHKNGDVVIRRDGRRIAVLPGIRLVGTLYEVERTLDGEINGHLRQGESLSENELRALTRRVVGLPPE